MAVQSRAKRQKKRKLTKEKARKILHDKEVHGHALTEKQRRFFGAIAGGQRRRKRDA